MLGSMKVLSFCHFLQGPACTQYLGDLGADVIKVEPLSGERSRDWLGANIGGVSGLFLSAFRNKRHLAVDIKTPEGLGIIMKLVREADVVFENYRSGVMDRLGLGYDDLRKVKPGIIYASGTGWSSAGPMVKREAQDLIVQARSGLAAATGYNGPRAVGAAVVDQHGGALLAMGIIAAFVKKLETGIGTRIEGSLYTAGLDLQSEPLTLYLSTRPGRKIFQRDSHLATWYHPAPYGCYRLKDAEVAVSVNDPLAMASALSSPRLVEALELDRFRNRNEYARIFAEVITEWTYDDFSKAFDAHGLWYGKIFDYEDVANDPQAEAVNAFRTVNVNGREAILVNHPLRYDGRTPDIRTASVDVGENTREILRDLGYSEGHIDDLMDRRVVHGPPSI